MKFLCDVLISYKIVNALQSLGFDAIHVNKILDKSETKDSDICKFADEKDYVVVTKDYDFEDSYRVKNTPKKLIKINLGNISNQVLIKIFEENFENLSKLITVNSFFVEFNDTGITYRS
jgi:predicted nuclease of predicted toxin-antitoxin system